MVALAACMLLAAIPAPGLAEQPELQVGYSARAILPEQQIPGVTGYFNLLMGPESRQMIEVEVTNHLPRPVRISVAVTNAGTSPNGLITYMGTEASGDAARLNLEDLVTFRDDLLTVGPEEAILALDGLEMILAPNVTVKLPFEVAVADEDILGQVLGGIVLLRLPFEEEETAEVSAMAIRSQYSYAIAVQLQSKLEPDIAPHFSLQWAGMTAVAGLDAVQVTLRNEAPLVITGANLRVQVFAAGEDTPILDVTKERVAMAPGSAMPFTSVWPEGVKLEPGEYTVTVDMAYDGETWHQSTVLSVQNKGA